MDIYNLADANRNLFYQMSSLIVLINLDHRLVLGTNSIVSQMGFNVGEDISGIGYADMKCAASEDAGTFEAQDKLVINSNKKIKLLSYHLYANGWKLVLGEKAPLTHHNKLVGIIANWIDITDSHLIDISRFLFEDKKPYPVNKKKFSYLIEDGKLNHYELSNRQIECLFFLLRGKTAKEIGNFLSLSPRTIESYINVIKCKLGCTSKEQIIEKSFQEGLYNIFPERFISSKLK